MRQYLSDLYRVDLASYLGVGGEPLPESVSGKARAPRSCPSAGTLSFLQWTPPWPQSRSGIVENDTDLHTAFSQGSPAEGPGQQQQGARWLQVRQEIDEEESALFEEGESSLQAFVHPFGHRFSCAFIPVLSFPSTSTGRQEKKAAAATTKSESRKFLLALSTVMTAFPPKVLAIAEKYIEHGLVETSSFRTVRLRGSSGADEPFPTGGMMTSALTAQCWSSDKRTTHRVSGYITDQSIGFSVCTCGTGTVSSVDGEKHVGNRCRHAAALFLLATNTTLESCEKVLSRADFQHQHESLLAPAAQGHPSQERSDVDEQAVSGVYLLAQKLKTTAPYIPKAVEMHGGLPLHMAQQQKAHTRRGGVAAGGAAAGAGATGTTGRRKRALLGDTVEVRGPSAPRRPLTPFFYFCSTAREAYSREHPGVSAAVMAKELGRQWNEMDPELKEKYVTESKADFDRFQAEWAVYVETDEYKTALRRYELSLVVPTGQTPTTATPLARSRKRGRHDETPPSALEGTGGEQRQQQQGLEPMASGVALNVAFELANDEWRRNDKGEWVCAWDSAESEAGAEDSEAGSGVDAMIDAPRAGTVSPAHSKVKRKKKPRKDVKPKLGSICVPHGEGEEEGEGTEFHEGSTNVGGSRTVDNLGTTGTGTDTQSALGGARSTHSRTRSHLQF